MGYEATIFSMVFLPPRKYGIRRKKKNKERKRGKDRRKYLFTVFGGGGPREEGKK